MYPSQIQLQPPTCTSNTIPKPLTMKHIHVCLCIHHKMYSLAISAQIYMHTYVMHTHTCTHKHLYTVLLYSQESQNTFEGYLVEARESNTSGDFAESSSIWGTWLQYQSSPYHALHCNRSSTSQDGPYPVSTDDSTNIAACRGGAIIAWASLHIVYD